MQLLRLQRRCSLSMRVGGTTPAIFLSASAIQVVTSLSPPPNKLQCRAQCLHLQDTSQPSPRIARDVAVPLNTPLASVIPLELNVVCVALSTVTTTEPVPDLNCYTTVALNYTVWTSLLTHRLHNL